MKRFEDYNPIAVALYYLCVTAITMFAMTPMVSVISLIAAVATCIVTKAADRRSHLFSLILFLILSVINPLVVHNGVTVLFYLNDRPITLEATLYGLNAAAMVCASLYWLRALSKAMTGDKVQYLVGRLSPKLALLISMVLRYVSLFKMRWRTIRDTQRTLGLYRDGNLIDAVRGRAAVLGILITWTLENGILTAESMESRGYGARRRTSFAIYRIHPTDVFLMLFIAGLTALSVIGVVHITTVYYPAIQLQLWHPYGTAFAVLCLIPIIIEIKEAIRWRYLISAS